MNIINVEIISPNKRERILGGLYIEFITRDNIVKDTIVEVLFEEKFHYFEVTDIALETNYKDLKVIAREVGYWADKFERQKDFDLRNIIGFEIKPVYDVTKLAQIKEESSWT